MDKNLNNREKLLQASILLFSEKNIAAVSIREIAHKAGVNSSLISYYFGGKEGLLKAIFDEHCNKSIDIINEIQKDIDQVKLNNTRIEKIISLLKKHKIENKDVHKILIKIFSELGEKRISKIIQNPKETIIQEKVFNMINILNIKDKFADQITKKQIVLFVTSMVHSPYSMFKIFDDMLGYKDISEMENDMFKFLETVLKELLQ